VRSPLTLSLSALALCLVTALPAAATPVDSFFDIFFDVTFDADLTTPDQDNTHAGFDLLFEPPPLGTDDLLYDSFGGTEGVDGFSLLLEETFTPDGFGGGVMSFLITNDNYLGEPMFPGVGASVDEASLQITFVDFGAPVLDATYAVDGNPGMDAWPFVGSEAPIDLSLAWLGSPELAGAQSIQVDVTLGAAVPEPTSLALVGSLAVGLFGFGLRRHLAAWPLSQRL